MAAFFSPGIKSRTIPEVFPYHPSSWDAAVDSFSAPNHAASFLRASASSYICFMVTRAFAAACCLFCRDAADVPPPPGFDGFFLVFFFFGGGAAAPVAVLVVGFVGAIVGTRCAVVPSGRPMPNEWSVSGSFYTRSLDIDSDRIGSRD